MGLITSTGGAGWDNPNNRDVILTDDLLAAVTADLCIDTSRVFTTGFSFGASMSYELACTRPTKFRGALVYEVGTLSGQNAAQCTTPIAWFQSEGIDDQVLSYAEMGLPILNVFTKAERLHRDDAADTSHERAQLHQLRGMLGGAPDPFLQLRRRREQPVQHHPARSLSGAKGSRTDDELGPDGGLELHHAVLKFYGSDCVLKTFQAVAATLAVALP